MVLKIGMYSAVCRGVVVIFYTVLLALGNQV